MNSKGYPQPSSLRASATLRISVLAYAIVALAGCSLLHPLRSKKPGTVPELPRKFGTILRIDSQHGFVLIQKDPFATLPDWEKPESAPVLYSSDPQTPSARLRLSPESRRNLVIADILDGNPNTGDSVFLPASSRTQIQPQKETEENPISGEATKDQEG